MNKLYVDFLFGKGILVSEDWAEDKVFPTLCLLGRNFGIRVESGRQLVSPSMVPAAARGLGWNVPDAFYRGFPQSVRALSPNELLFDQIVHYLTTYGLGCFDEPGHSLLEENLERTLFREETEPKPFRAVSEEEAMKLVAGYVDAMLMNTRPLADDQYELVHTFVTEEHYPVRRCACKDTVVRLMLDTREVALARLLALPDVIRLVEQLQYQVYGSENIRKLNLRNQDRRFIASVLDSLLADPKCDVITCFEKKQVWNGLLHHIHYKPRTGTGEEFVAGMRGDKNLSVYAEYEALLADDDPVAAARLLCRKKGAATMLRHLNHLLALCGSPEQVQEIISLIDTKNRVVLIQMMMSYASYDDSKPRTFKFSRFGKLKIHKEDRDAAADRATLDKYTRELAVEALRDALARSCKGRLGRVYADEAMKGVAVSVHAGLGNSGYGTLPTGTRMKLPEGKKIRAFTYWEKVNDIDLSCHIYPEPMDGSGHFAYYSMARSQSDAIRFSGDQTSGYNGGSEYFDVDPEAFRALYPQAKYLVFYNNVFSGVNFNQVVCTAGYMLRDKMDSGEIFEPKTVATSFAITAESTEACLFALDLETNELVWLNLAIDSSNRVGGMNGLDFISSYLTAAQVLSVYDLACMMATEVVDDPARAEVVFSDRELTLPEGVRQIRSADYEIITGLING